MSHKIVKSMASPNPEQFKKEQEGLLVTAHPLPPLNTSIFKGEESDAILVMNGQIRVQAQGEESTLSRGDKLYLKNAGQIIVTVLSGTGAFFLKASKKADQAVKAA